MTRPIAEIESIVTALVAAPALSSARAELASGAIEPSALKAYCEARVAAALAGDPRVAALSDDARKEVSNRASEALARWAPRTSKRISPGERVLGWSAPERGAWRAELATRCVSPVAVLIAQTHHTLGLSADDPRRRDLAWDLVNTAITAVRYATVVALADYMDGGPSNPQLNRALLDALARPADGTWSSLLFAPKDTAAEHGLLAVLAARGGAVSALSALRAKLDRSELPRDVTQLAKLSALGTLESVIRLFVEVRNALVHGEYARRRPPPEVLTPLAELLDVLLAHLAPLLTTPVWLRDGEAILQANGSALAPSAAPPTALSPSWTGEPTLVDGTRALSLSPWLTAADLAAAVAHAEGEPDARDLGLLELCFFNKFESELLHLVGFSSRAQLAHRELLEREGAEAAYRAFASRLETLRMRSAPAQSRKQDPVFRFDALATFHAENFVGRDAVIAAIEAFVAQRPAAMGVITAEPGLGKSALLSHFYRAHGGPDAANGWIFHFASRADHRDNPVLGLRSLIAQAERQIDRIAGPTAHKPIPWTYDELVERFRASLAKLGATQQSRGEHAVLVLDALDEQAPRPGAPPDSIFAALPEDLPDGVVALVSVRVGRDGAPVGIARSQLDGPRGCGIPGASPLEGLSPAAAGTLVRDRLAAERPSLAQVSDAVIARIAEAARRREDGTLDPFYLRFLASGVRDGSLRLETPADVPEDLDAFFDAEWWGLDPSHDLLLHRMVGMLAEMEGFGDDAFFADVMRLPAETIARLRFGIQKLLVQSGGEDGSDPRYGLFHDRFRWFVQRKFRARDRALALHKPLLEACRRGISAADHYAVHYHSLHLRELALHPGLTETERSRFRDALWELVHDDGFVKRKYLATRDETALRVDFLRSFEVFKPTLEQAPALQRLRAGQCTALACRSITTVSDVANLARAALHDLAREGDAVRVLQLVEAARAGGEHLRCMTLLRAAASMREVNLDPALLFEALEDASIQLHATDRPFLERLLREADAPAHLVEHILGQLPSEGPLPAAEPLPADPEPARDPAADEDDDGEDGEDGDGEDQGGEAEDGEDGDGEDGEEGGEDP